MGTRSLTFVYTDHYGSEGAKPIINMYRQFDGYPEGHGAELAEFLNSFEAITNGIAVGETRKTANGMGCLAAQLVAHFKTDSNGEESKSIRGRNPMIVGGFYLYPIESVDCGQEYEYHVYSDRVTVYGWNKEHLFTGPWSEFKKWCNEGDQVMDFKSQEGKQNILELLRSGATTITFTKVNGDKRVMECTLKPELIKDYTEPSGKKQANDDVCAVYDVVNEGWRSFRWDSVTKVE